MIIGTIEGCKIRLEDGPEGEKVTFIADADIDADGANGQNDARAAYKADDSGSEALANGGMGIRHPKWSALRTGLTTLSSLKTASRRFLLVASSSLRPLTTSSANRRIPQSGDI